MDLSKSKESRYPNIIFVKQKSKIRVKILCKNKLILNKATLKEGKKV